MICCAANGVIEQQLAAVMRFWQGNLPADKVVLAEPQPLQHV
jgi:hypothetical protein